VQPCKACFIDHAKWASSYIPLDDRSIHHPSVGPFVILPPANRQRKVFPRRTWSQHLYERGKQNLSLRLRYLLRLPNNA
jgi:hypothetical protein